MRLGVIGGSSLVTFDPKDEFGAIGLEIVDKSEVEVTTSYGTVKLRKYELKGANAAHTIFFMNRHCHPTGGITPPHKINHHANMRALYDQKVDAVVSTTSVGTLHANFPPGRVGVTRQYIDFSGVATTYHEVDAKFTSVTQPFCPKINKGLLETLRRVQNLSPEVKLEFTYFLTVGPQYETEAEVSAADRLGADVVGMTSPREAKLCAELGVPYASLTIASNWAAGRYPGDPNAKLDHAEVAETSKTTTGTIIACLIDLLKAAQG